GSMLMLLDKPADPVAGPIVGRYYCFAKNDWDAGVPLLGIGGDVLMKKAVEKELAKPAEAAAQVALADAWWNVSLKEPNKSYKNAVQMHAKSWYDRALPGLSGLEKLKIEKQLEPLRSAADYEPPLSADPEINAGLDWLARH